MRALLRVGISRDDVPGVESALPIRAPACRHATAGQRPTDRTRSTRPPEPEVSRVRRPPLLGRAACAALGSARMVAKRSAGPTEPDLRLISSGMRVIVRIGLLLVAVASTLEAQESAPAS